ncbi:McrB family protein [Hymenobacter sp. BT730]|uniref:McrB family protein n=1 Tax=Hymenobacter sp. BT730 TaxID=3063332 RepID=UPI0026DF41F3|nr:AAA family ATPase [Hymenobacter sp. BT730]
MSADIIISFMARPLVQSKADVLKNFESFIRLRDSRKPNEVKQYQAYLKSAKVLVVEKVNGQREYAPSRFIGYRNNSIKEHEADVDKDGRTSNGKLERLFGRIYYDENESQRFAIFCKKHGVDKDIDGLSTPVKFIFAGYPPSTEASSIKPRISSSAGSPDDAETLNSMKPLVGPKTPLNQILYGPPGTGKTYHTVARAIAILEGVSDEELAEQYPIEKRAALRQKFEEYQRASRIGFVTFHQAFTYEDFVEGIKPLPPTKGAEEADIEESDTDNDGNINQVGAVQYAVRKGIFRQMCETAASAVPSDEAVSLTRPSFQELYTGFLNLLQERIRSTKGPVIFHTKERYGVQLTAVNTKTGRLTFQYGKGKEIDFASQLNNDGTYSHVDKSKTEKLYHLYSSIDQIKHLKRDIIDKVGGSAKSLQWVVFNELKKFEVALLTQQRDEQQTKPSPRFVLIIDEINRGNVANIFGELITLLEDDKRAGCPEALSITLPYSQEEFSVPANLYLLGTMNTADRSVESLDTALRRRFSFTEMLPNPEILPEDVEGVNLREMLTAINARLEQLLDHDHCIGHALLMRVTTLDSLREAFKRNILPLLQEYFFGDWGKIGLVLGSAFIQPVNKKTNPGGYKLLSFDKYNVGELNEKPVYKLANVLKLEAKAFQDIYA